MKYVIVPIVKIILLIGVLVLSPIRIIWNLFFNFKWIGIRKSFTVDGDCFYDKESYPEGFFYELFSKQATDEFLND